MMAVALATAATAFGQDDLVKQALKQKSNPAEAVKILTPALTSAETKDKAAAWGAMSEIQYQFYSIAYDAMVQNQFKTEKTPIDTVGMYNGVAESIKAAIKCDEFDMQPNEKGKESKCSCAAGKLLEVNDNIEPADGSNQCKDNIVPWKMVAWQFLCCREKKESKHLHKGKVSCAKDLCRYHSRKTGIELENYKCN